MTVNLNELNPEEQTVSLKSLTEGVPLEKVNYQATIATLAAERVKGFIEEDEEIKVSSVHDIQPTNTYDRYVNLLQQGQEDLIRHEIASEILSEKFKLMEELQVDALESGDKDLLQAVSELQVGVDIEAEKLTVLEREAAKHIVETGEDEEARLQLAWTPYTEVESERLAKNLFMENTMSKLVNTLGLDLNTATDVGAVFWPGATAAILDQNVKTDLDPFWPGEDLEEQKSKFDTLSLDDQKIIVDQIIANHEDDPLHSLIIIGYLNNLSSFDVWLENAGGFLDLVTLGLLGVTRLTMLARAAKIAESLRKGKVATTGITVGNRETALKQAVSVDDSVKRGDIPYDSDVARETAELILEKQAVLLGDTTGVGISGRLREYLVEIHSATKAFLESPRVKLLDPVQRDKMIRDMQQSLASDLIDNGMRHADIAKIPSIQPEVTDDIFGSIYTVVYGNDKAEGFGSLEQATETAKLLKLDDYKVVPMETNGAYYISISKRASNQAGFIDPVKTEGFGKRVGAIARSLLSTSSIVDRRSQELGHLTASARESLVAAGKRLEKVKALVKGADKDYLEAVIELGTREHNGTWFSTQTLRERFRFTDEQVAAYQAFRAEENLTDLVQNAAEFITLNSEGYRTIKLRKPIENLDEFAAKPILFNDIAKPETKVFWDASKRKAINIKSEADLKTFEKKGYKLYQLRGARETEAEVPVQFILMKSTDGTEHSLNLRQIHYRPGGRTVYRDKWFLKMGRMRTGPGGTNIVFRAKTFGVGEQAGVEEAKKMFEKAREAYLSGRATRDAEIADATGGRFKNARVFEEYVGKKNLEKNLPFEIVRDGESLPSINAAIAKGTASALVEDINEMHTIQRMIAVEGSFKSQRGGRLPMFREGHIEDFDVGAPAPIVSPFETSAASLTRAIRVASLSTFRKRQTEAWFQTFKHVLNIKNYPKRTPLGWLTEADEHKYLPLTGSSIDKAQQVKAIAQAKAMESHIKSVLNTETWYDMKRREFLEGAIAKVTPKLEKYGMGENMIHNIEKFDPVKFLRSVVYHKTMGLFNFKQPATQLQATALMATIDPINGIEAAMTTPILGALLLSENSNTIGVFAKAIAKIVPGSNAAKVKEGLEVLKKTENWRMNSAALPEQEYLHLSAPTILKKVLEYGEQPFLVSERYNKIASTYAAYLRWRKSNPNAKITDEVIDTIRTNGESMVASMGKVDQARLQQGLTGLFTQFWGYPLRFLEMVAPTTIGGSRNFTTQQKWQIALGQLAMHGVGGTVGVGPGRHMREVINRDWVERFGEPADERLLDLMEKGFISGILLTALLDAEEVDYYEKGLNFIESGPGKLVSRVVTGNWDELISIDSAGLTALTDIGEDLVDFAQAIFAFTPLHPEITGEQALRGLTVASKELFVKNISSFTQAERTLWALQHKQFRTSRGEVVRDDVTISQTVADFFGIKTSGEASTRAMQDLIKYHSADEKKTIKHLSQQFRLFLESEGTEKDKESWASIRHIYMSRHDDNRHHAIQTAALRAVQRDSKGRYERRLMDFYAPRRQD